jgi:hypothetical protein
VAVLGSMHSPDGSWRIEVIWERGSRFYRLWHDGVPYRDISSIYELHRVLRAEADLDLADLIED